MGEKGAKRVGLLGIGIENIRRNKLIIATFVKPEKEKDDKRER